MPNAKCQMSTERQPRPILFGAWHSSFGISSAFTLMELILVMLVISVVMAVSAPSLRGFFASRKNSDASLSVLAVAKWAGSQAVAQGRVYRLNIDGQSGQYWLTAQDGGAFVDVNGDFGQRFHVPDETTISLRTESSDPGQPGVSYVQFYPSGRSDIATIELKDRTGAVYQVSCRSATEPFRVISPSEAK